MSGPGPELAHNRGRDPGSRSPTPPGASCEARVKFDETCLKRLFEESFEETINDLNYLWVTLLMASRGHLFEDTCVADTYLKRLLMRLLKRVLMTLV